MKTEIEFLQELKDYINGGLDKNNLNAFNLPQELWVDIKTLINQRIKKIKIPKNNLPISTQAFNDLCKIKLNLKTDKYHFYYAGEDLFSSKSKFECKLQQKILQKELNA
jgi:hypothetical protein